MSEQEKKCSICGGTANFVIQLESNKNEEFPFYLCSDHEYLYDGMKAKRIPIDTMFTETKDSLK